MKVKPKLQVLISVLGKSGLERLVCSKLPVVDGVEYMVGLQCPSGEVVTIPALFELREDIAVCRLDSIGLSKNRNSLLESATGEVVMFGDDDVDYTKEGLEAVMECFNDSSLDFATFCFASSSAEKAYPDYSFPLIAMPKGYYVSSIELACRLSSVGQVRFNEQFGLGGRYLCGEEDLFVDSLLRKGEKGVYFPVAVSRHDSLTTGLRMKGRLPYYIAQCAVAREKSSRFWLLTVLRRAGGNILKSRFRVAWLWASGAISLICEKK